MMILLALGLAAAAFIFVHRLRVRFNKMAEDVKNVADVNADLIDRVEAVEAADVPAAEATVAAAQNSAAATV